MGERCPPGEERAAPQLLQAAPRYPAAPAKKGVPRPPHLRPHPAVGAQTRTRTSLLEPPARSASGGFAAATVRRHLSRAPQPPLPTAAVGNRGARRARRPPSPSAQLGGRVGGREAGEAGRGRPLPAAPRGGRRGSPSSIPSPGDSPEERAPGSAGAAALPLPHAPVAAAGPLSSQGSAQSPRGGRLRGVPAPGGGRGSGLRGTPPAAPADLRTHRALDARANNTASRRPHRPLPARDSPRPGAATRARSRGDGGRQLPRLPPCPPGAAPRQYRSPRLSVSLRSRALGAQMQPGGRRSPRPLTRRRRNALSPLSCGLW